MAHYVTWATAKQIHIASVSKSGGLNFKKKAALLSATGSNPLMTICGRQIPETNHTTNDLSDANHSKLCAVCASANRIW
jgi:hypothetical protein